MTIPAFAGAIGGAVLLLIVNVVFALALVGTLRDLPYMWASYLAVTFATVVTMKLLRDRGTDLWLDGDVGKNVVSGFLWAALLAVAADALALFGDFRHGYGGGVDVEEIVRLFVPAAIAEELLVRGYAFQKLLVVGRSFAVVVGSLVFTAMHAGNNAVSSIGLLNIFMAGVVLSLAVIWKQSLWFGIAAHLGWNLMIGPVLGHEVSGLRLSRSVLTTVDNGPALITGGAFGIEGSLSVTAIALGVTLSLIWRISKNQKALQTVTSSASQTDRELQ